MIVEVMEHTQVVQRDAAFVVVERSTSEPIQRCENLHRAVRIAQDWSERIGMIVRRAA